MRKVVIDIYQYDELPDSIRASIREKWREWITQDCQWYQDVYSHAVEVAGALGIEFDRKNNSRAPAIYFSGFSSQGDGACFEGKYSYAKQAPKKVEALCGPASPMIALAKELAAIQKKHFYKVTAEVNHRSQYYHSRSTSIDVEVDGKDADDTTETSITEALRRFMDWIYTELQAEYEFLTSDAEIEQTIRDLGHEYTLDGKVYTEKTPEVMAG